MKVTVFSPTIRECGISVYSRRVTETLPQGFEVSVVPTGRDGGGFVAADSALAMNSGDVAHIHYEHSFFRNAQGLLDYPEFLRGITVPKVVTLHTLPTTERQCRSPRLSERGWYQTLLSWADHYVVHSQVHVEFLSRYLPLERIHLFPHPVERQLPLVASMVDCRKRYDAIGKRVVTVFGFLKPHKGYELMLMAMRSLPSDVKLILAGGIQHGDDYRYLEQLQELIRLFGLQDRVTITGYVPEMDISALMNITDLVVAPFQSMSISGSIATAFAYGKPVLASDIEQNLEVSRWSGAIAHFKTGQVIDLATQTEAVLGNPEYQLFLARNATLYAEKYSFSAFSEKMAAVYQAAARRTRPRRVRGPSVALLSMSGESKSQDVFSNLVHTFEAAGIPVIHEGAAGTVSDCSEELPDISVTTIHPTDLDRANHVEFPEIEASKGSQYRIAHWSWDLPTLPEKWISHLARFDEVWVPSSFVEGTFPVSWRRPVFRLPYGVQLSSPKPSSRAECGLPAEGFLFLSVFDSSDYLQLTGALNGIAAFQRAFQPGDKDVHFVLREVGAQASQTEAIVDAVRHWPNIHLLQAHESTVDPEALIQVSDCFVSLEPSTSFGLVGAKAMLAGKPTIQMAWSGNTDYLNAAGALMVRHQLSVLKKSHVLPGSLYQAGQIWAEPDLDLAADGMRHMYGNQQFGIQMGEAARKHILENFSHQAVGALVRNRLRDLGFEGGLDRVSRSQISVDCEIVGGSEVGRIEEMAGLTLPLQYHGAASLG